MNFCELWDFFLISVLISLVSWGFDGFFINDLGTQGLMAMGVKHGIITLLPLNVFRCSGAESDSSISCSLALSESSCYLHSIDFAVFYHLLFLGIFQSLLSKFL